MIDSHTDPKIKCDCSMQEFENVSFHPSNCEIPGRLSIQMLSSRIPTRHLACCMKPPNGSISVSIGLPVAAVECVAQDTIDKDTFARLQPAFAARATRNTNMSHGPKFLSYRPPILTQRGRRSRDTISLCL